MFGFPIVTTSAIVLVVCVVAVCCLYFLGAHVMKFTLNEKEWGKEIVNPLLLFKKLRGFLVSNNGTLRVGAKLRYGAHTYSVRSVERGYIITGYWTYLFPSEGTIVYTDSSMAGAYFSSLIELTEFVDKHFSIKRVGTATFRFNPLLLLVFPLADLSLFTFSIAPVATVAVLATVGTILSVRWVSGKLAKNVKQTVNHEERISKLENKDAK